MSVILSRPQWVKSWQLSCVCSWYECHRPVPQNLASDQSYLWRCRQQQREEWLQYWIQMCPFLYNGRCYLYRSPVHIIEGWVDIQGQGTVEWLPGGGNRWKKNEMKKKNNILMISCKTVVSPCITNEFSYNGIILKWCPRTWTSWHSMPEKILNSITKNYKLDHPEFI